MTPEAMEALLQVLAATPEPPDAEADPSDVITAAQEMVEQRQERLLALQDVLGRAPATREEAATILAQIREREDGWQAAMMRARHELTQRVAAARHMRRRYSSEP